MWFRGRTVVVMIVLTAIVASTATYAYQELPGWFSTTTELENGKDLSASAEGIQKDELDKLNKAIELIQRRFLLPIDRKQLLDGAVQGMVEVLNDPNSIYKTQSEAENFAAAIEGAFTGIGADLRVKRGAIIVEATYRGSPAEKAGLQPKDVLLSVNGESLTGVALSEAVTKIRGPKGTKAKLKVQRAGSVEPIELELIREQIDRVTVQSTIEAGDIGHLMINQFNAETAVQVAEQLAEMEQEGMKGLVIDVRDNPGGMLESVVLVVDQFVEKGKPIVQYEYKDGKHNTEYAPNGLKGDQRYPIVVLMNKGSASASEILAGSLKQAANAVLVGETTYGKGTVQVNFDDWLGDGSLIKLTVYKWLLPDGTWVHEKGIMPDVPVSQPDYFLASILPRDYVLHYNANSEAVRNLQNILTGVGFPPDRHDGYFSQMTKDALEAFQLQEELPVTGEVDGTTAQRLEELLNEIISEPDNDNQLQAAIAQARQMFTTS